jgi:hypothetical protein
MKTAIATLAAAALFAAVCAAQAGEDRPWRVHYSLRGAGRDIAIVARDSQVAAAVEIARERHSAEVERQKLQAEVSARRQGSGSNCPPATGRAGRQWRV